MDNSRLGGMEEENDGPILSSFAGTEGDFLSGGRLAHYKGKPNEAVHEKQALASADLMQGLAHRAMVSLKQCKYSPWIKNGIKNKSKY